MNPSTPLNDTHVLRLIKESPSFCKFNLLSKELQISDSVDDELIDLPKGDDRGEHAQVGHCDQIEATSAKRTSPRNFSEELLRGTSSNFFNLSDRFSYTSSVSLYVELSQILLDKLPAALSHLVDFNYEPTLFSNQ